MDDNDDHNEERMGEFSDLVHKVTEQVEAIGLYPAHAPVTVSQAPPHGDEKPDPVIQMRFQIGDVAWLPRVQTPEQFDLDTQFEVAMPSETEMEALRIRSMMEERGDV